MKDQLEGSDENSIREMLRDTLGQLSAGDDRDKLDDIITRLYDETDVSDDVRRDFEEGIIGNIFTDPNNDFVQELLDTSQSGGDWRERVQDRITRIGAIRDYWTNWHRETGTQIGLFPSQEQEEEIASDLEDTPTEVIVSDPNVITGITNPPTPIPATDQDDPPTEGYTPNRVYDFGDYEHLWDQIQQEELDPNRSGSLDSPIEVPKMPIISPGITGTTRDVDITSTTPGPTDREVGVTTSFTDSTDQLGAAIDTASGFTAPTARRSYTGNRFTGTSAKGVRTKRSEKRTGLEELKRGPNMKINSLNV